MAAVDTVEFFKHEEAFMEYRRTVYEISAQTIKSNRTDLKLFKKFIEDKQNKIKS